MSLPSASALIVTLSMVVPAMAGAQEARSRDAFFDSDGVRIRYTVRGSGPPVLLVHGFALSLESWAQTGLLDSLAAHNMVISLDLRGHGASDKPLDPAAYGSTFVEDLVRLMDYLGIQRAHVIGYSMGAAITLKLLTTYPRRVASAVVGGAGWRPAELGPPEPVVQYEDKLTRVTRGEVTFEEALTEAGAPPLPPELRAVVSRNDPRVLLAVLQGNRRGLESVTEEELRANSVPVLALVGESDSARPDVERMAGIMANLDVVIVPEATHFTAVGHPLFLQQVLQFLGSQ
jgi:pimeloyl-ACP methyl ester carboxylesterase